MSKHKDRPLAIAALVVIVIALALGFHYLGPRDHQRAVTADARRVDDLRAIAIAIAARGATQSLPATLAGLAPGFAASLKDPVTQAAYEYRLTSATTFELCAVFATASAEGEDTPRPHPGRWDHPPGHYCYQLDARATNIY